MSNKVLVGLLAIVIIALGILFATTKRTPIPKPSPVTASLASLSTNPAPWPAEAQHLPQRLKAANLSLLSAEGTAQHIHAHLDIYVHGQPIEVPSDIGFGPQGGISPIHTHDTAGIVHIESADAFAVYTLGQFFDVWGVKLSASNIGGYANDSANTLVVYDDGKKVNDPANLALKSHHEIAVMYGTAKEQPTAPKSYQFESGL